MHASNAAEGTSVQDNSGALKYVAVEMAHPQGANDNNQQKPEKDSDDTHGNQPPGLA
jgi:hypothetical protein